MTEKALAVNAVAKNQAVKAERMFVTLFIAGAVRQVESWGKSKEDGLSVWLAFVRNVLGVCTQALKGVRYMYGK